MGDEQVIHDLTGVPVDEVGRMLEVMRELTEEESQAFGRWCMERTYRMPERGELVPPPPRTSATKLRDDIAQWREERGY